MTKRFARTWRMLVAVALLVSSVGVAMSSSGEVLAGSGLNRWRWGDAGLTLSSSSYKYSNMSGFWQAVVNSNGCNIAVDGIYGNITTWYTATFQNAILGYNNGGVMTPAMLNSFHGATSVYGQRLVYTGYTDGFATRHYGYYGGFTGSNDTRLGWNPFSTQWLFSQYPNSNPTSLVPATPSRTIGSVGACA
jgi:hypothetical protein